MRQTIVREWRVASSRRAQPLWFRIIKWTVFLAVSAALLGSRRFWYWLLAASLASITVHVIWRWKTQGWTRPWGGWNDREAGRPRPGATARQVALAQDSLD